MRDARAYPVSLTRPPADDEDARLRRMRRMQQGLIDAELRASRRSILAAFRRRLRTDSTALATDDFLSLADRVVVETAILLAARTVGGADACHLQVYGPDTGVLRMTRHHGLPSAFLDSFATVDPSTPSACGTALVTGDPVLVDDVTTSPIFRGRPTLQVMLAAACRAVQAYPLRDDHGDLLGMLSLHHRATGRHPGQERLAWAAGRALARHPAEIDPAVPGGRGTPDDRFTTAHPAGDVSTVTARGDLDALTAPDFADHVRHAVADLPAGHVLIVDLRGLSFLAAAGVRTLLDTAGLCAARSIDLYLVVGADQHTRLVLERLGATHALRVVDDPAHVPDRYRP